MTGIELQFVGCPPRSLFNYTDGAMPAPTQTDCQHFAFVRFYTREYYRERS